jgi:hypothetical protein
VKNGNTARNINTVQNGNTTQKTFTVQNGNTAQKINTVRNGNTAQHGNTVQGEPTKSPAADDLLKMPLSLFSLVPSSIPHFSFPAFHIRPGQSNRSRSHLGRPIARGSVRDDTGGGGWFDRHVRQEAGGEGIDTQEMSGGLTESPSPRAPACAPLTPPLRTPHRAQGHWTERVRWLTLFPPSGPRCRAGGF